MKRGRPPGLRKGFKYHTVIARKKVPEYSVWIGMHSRCENPRSPVWKNYGGRGISVCSRWHGRQGYDNFMDDMGPRPPGHWIERVDNDGNYEPKNCKWATPKEQGANRRARPANPNSFFGRCKIAGIPFQVARQRVRKLGWTEEEALSTPKRAPGSHRTDIDGHRSFVFKALAEERAA